MSKNRRHHIVVHLFWVVLSLAICWGAVRLGPGRFTEPGPGFMPLLMGGLMLVLTIIGASERGASEKAAALPGKEKLILLGMTVAALWLYAVLLSRLGFVIDTLLLMLFLFSVIQKVKWTTAVLASVVSVGICYFLFSSLGAEFPRGIFP